MSLVFVYDVFYVLVIPYVFWRGVMVDVVTDFSRMSLVYCVKYPYLLGHISKAMFHGHFGPLTIAYGIDLAIAYLVVRKMKSGQPALLHLVPMTLGAVFSFDGEREIFWSCGRELR